MQPLDEVFLSRVPVLGRYPNQLSIAIQKIDAAPVGDLGDRKSGDSLQRTFVVERLRQNPTRLAEEAFTRLGAIIRCMPRNRRELVGLVVVSGGQHFVQSNPRTAKNPCKIAM